MSELTPNLGLFKYDPIVDGKETFSIQTALNDNWDILDTKSGSPETVVDGTTWYRRFTDGWKEMGGEVSLRETETTWTQPTLTKNGTLGGESFAVSGGKNNEAYKGFDKNTSTTVDIRNDYSYPLIFYNSVSLNISTIIFYWKYESYWASGTNGILYGSNDGSNWETVQSGFGGTTDTSSGSLTVNITNFNYKYGKIEFPSATSYNIARVKEIDIIATYKTEVANSITFPLSFSNTNYSYTFANQDGGGMDAYVSNKTITGMTLSNTNSGSASWTACGY